MSNDFDAWWFIQRCFMHSIKQKLIPCKLCTYHIITQVKAYVIILCEVLDFGIFLHNMLRYILISCTFLGAFKLVNLIGTLKHIQKILMFKAIKIDQYGVFTMIRNPIRFDAFSNLEIWIDVLCIYNLDVIVILPLLLYNSIGYYTSNKLFIITCDLDN